MRAESNKSERSARAAFVARALALAGAVAAAGALIAVLSGSPAEAFPGPSTQTQAPLCTSGVPDAYRTLDTIAGCSTTTTVAASSDFTLAISYSTGMVTWKACGSPSLSATTVQLYIDGQAVTGGSATVGGGGCTDETNTAVCLAPGGHTGTAVDGPNQASKSFTVTSSGCSNPQLLSGSGPQAGHAGSGRLAFTGANIVLLLVAAGLLMSIGYSAIRLTKLRR